MEVVFIYQQHTGTHCYHFWRQKKNTDKSKSDLDGLVSETPDGDVQETVNIY